MAANLACATLASKRQNVVFTAQRARILLAVSKAKPVSLIAAAASAGQRRFGESYLKKR
ncbi:MAG: hypothetical protein R3F37_17000 [Candidatus Competibacteraceae bacterium]